MNYKFLTIALILLIPLGDVSADDGSVALVERGLNAYAKDGAREAIISWIKGSGLEGSKDAMSQANNLRQIEDFYGAYKSYEIIKEHKISSKSRMVVLVMNYEKGPLFARFQTYRTDAGEWVSTEFKFHTEATQILPSSIVFGE